MPLDVIVLGAGLVGLSAALNVQKLLRQVRVTVIADQYGVDTTSPVTAGIFLPIPGLVKGVDPLTVREWLEDSWNHHFARAKSPDGPESGQTLMSGYCLWSHQGQHVIPDLVYNYHRLSTYEMMDHDFHFRHGCRFATVLVEQEKYLRWLMKQFRENGGQLIFDTVYSLQELYGRCDVVVNCSGIRGREQSADPDLVPDKGYVVQVEAAWAKNFLVTDNNISILPNGPDCDVVNVGHIWQPHEYDPTMDPDVAHLVLEKAQALVTPLTGSKVIRQWAEKKACREPPRVEVEMLNCGGPILPVVHNLGLGMDPLSLAWGTGLSVARSVQDIQRVIKPFAKHTLPFHTLL